MDGIILNISESQIPTLHDSGLLSDSYLEDAGLLSIHREIISESGPARPTLCPTQILDPKKLPPAQIIYWIELQFFKIITFQPGFVARLDLKAKLMSRVIDTLSLYRPPISLLPRSQVRPSWCSVTGAVSPGGSQNSLLMTCLNNPQCPLITAGIRFENKPFWAVSSIKV